MSEQLPQNEYQESVRQADAEYKEISSFTSWSTLTIEKNRWDSHFKMVHELGGDNPDRFAKARDVAKRAAAIDTGAIEGLYELDRGITITIALQSAMWEATSQKVDEKARSFIECQLGAYDYVLDFATKKVPIAEAWVRDLHARLCSAQATFKALTPQGFQEQTLKYGEYKALPNHVRLSDGSLHSYAPVSKTPSEMYRLCAELRAAEFEAAHPVVQAAYAHHALTRIHPFQDGNGRVARALASVFLYRGASIPLLILVAHRGEYIAALEKADKGDHQPFVDFVFERCIESFLLVAESLRAADVADPSETLERVRALHVTRGGYTHHEVDVAGLDLLHAFNVQLDQQAAPLRIPNQVAVNVARSSPGYPKAPDGWRSPVSASLEAVQLSVTSTGPAEASLVRHFFIYLPRDCGRDDEIMIHCQENGWEYRIPITKILGSNRSVMDLQVAMFAHRALGEAMADLEKMGKVNMRAQGY